MAEPDSGIQSATRFFSFRWAYLLLACLLWFNLLFILFTTDDASFFAPAYIVWNLITGDFSGIAGLGLDGVFGFELYRHTAETAFVTCVLLAVALCALMIPQSGQTKSLPAKRGMHLRAKVIVSLMIGIVTAALVAGLLDAMRVDVLSLFVKFGWVPSPVNTFTGYYQPSFSPSVGIISMPSLVSLSLIVLLTAAATFFVMSLTTLGRDRYWQVERWTLLLTLAGVALVLFSAIFVSDDYYGYYSHDYFLGGCYTSWIVGWVMLTFGWTCRTLLLMMMMQYEKAVADSDEPVCFACGYDLRMLASDKCPECGTPVGPNLLAKLHAETEAKEKAKAEEARKAAQVVDELLS